MSDGVLSRALLPHELDGFTQLLQRLGVLDYDDVAAELTCNACLDLIRHQPSSDMRAVIALDQELAEVFEDYLEVSLATDQARQVRESLYPAVHGSSPALTVAPAPPAPPPAGPAPAPPPAGPAPAPPPAGLPEVTALPADPFGAAGADAGDLGRAPGSGAVFEPEGGMHDAGLGYYDMLAQAAQEVGYYEHNPEHPYWEQPALDWGDPTFHSVPSIHVPTFSTAMATAVAVPVVVAPVFHPGATAHATYMAPVVELAAPHRSALASNHYVTPAIAQHRPDIPAPRTPPGSPPQPIPPPRTPPRTPPQRAGISFPKAGTSPTNEASGSSQAQEEVPGGSTAHAKVLQDQKDLSRRLLRQGPRGGGRGGPAAAVRAPEQQTSPEASAGGQRPQRGAAAGGRPGRCMGCGRTTPPRDLHLPPAVLLDADSEPGDLICTACLSEMGLPVPQLEDSLLAELAAPLPAGGAPSAQPEAPSSLAGAGEEAAEAEAALPAAELSEEQREEQRLEEERRVEKEKEKERAQMKKVILSSIGFTESDGPSQRVHAAKPIKMTGKNDPFAAPREKVVRVVPMQAGVRRTVHLQAPPAASAAPSPTAPAGTALSPAAPPSGAEASPAAAPAISAARPPAPQGPGMPLTLEEIGAQLYPMIVKVAPALRGTGAEGPDKRDRSSAPKIMGMLRRLGERPLLKMLHSQTEMNAKVNECVMVLKKAGFHFA